MVRFLKTLQHIEANNILVIGTKETLLTQTKSDTWLNRLLDRICTAGNESSPVNISLLNSIVEYLSPTEEAGASAETFLRCRDATKRLVFGALPTACSRHNSPARPHGITDLVKKCKGKGDLIVALALDKEDYAFASGCAVARAFPLYNKQKGKVLGLPAQTLSDTVTIENDGVSVVFSKINEEDLAKISHTSDGIQLASRLVDAPPNELHTDAFIAEVQKVANELENVSLTVIRGEELKNQGFGGIYGVGKAAVHPPALAILSYFPHGVSQEGTGGVAFVGKGIVFDTGGLSLKTPQFMPGMKRDMGGAAAILGGFQAAVKCGYEKPLHALFCLAENAVGPIATKPDDVHTLYSGKTVEINNTDAEGRLVLSDGVAYAAKHLRPEIIVDIATLTGAQGIATGRNIGALYCNDEHLERAAVRAGRYSGDLTHPMPYVPEFFRPEFSSAIADMKNSVKDRTNAQVSCAGQFIGNNLGDFIQNGRWLHVDMAYPSFSTDERATGYGVALIQGILKEL